MYPALPHNSTTFWNMDYPILQQTQCQRCGQEHFHAGQCKALTRKCFKCGDYGHYGKFCQMTASRNNTGARQKSQKRKQRDIQRYINFRDRKSVCMELPFYSLETSELIDLMPNWKTVRILELQEECDDLQVHLEIGVVVYEQTKSNLDQVHQEKEELQKQVSELSATILDLQETNKQQKISDSQFSSQIESLTKENVKLKSECKRVQQCNKQISEKQAKSQETIQTKNDQLVTLFHHSNTLQALKFDLLLENAQLKEEFELLLKLINKTAKSEPCRRCGTSHKRKDHCPAQGWECRNCYKDNHFTVVCLKEHDGTYEPDQQTQDLMYMIYSTMVNKTKTT